MLHVMRKGSTIPRSGGRASATTTYEIIRLVRPLFRHLLKTVESNLAGSGVTVPMRGVLERLSESGPQTVPRLAEVLLIPRQFAQQIVNELHRAGLTEQVSNQSHKRSWLIRLTPAGEDCFRRIRKQEQSVTRSIARGMRQDDVETCLRVLSHMTTGFEAVARVERASPKGRVP